MRKKWFTFKNKRKFPGWVTWLLSWLMRGIAATYRLKIDDSAGWLASRRPWPVLVAIWHEKILFLPTLAPQGLLDGMCVMISRSRDGEYISDLVARFHLRAVRGSSGAGHGGAQAVLQLLEAMKQGLSPILTVDGPRGPRHCVQPGILLLAEKTGAPILPVTLTAPRHWCFKSWDRTQFPVPFSRVTLHFGAPIAMEAGEGREALASRLSKALDQLEISG